MKKTLAAATCCFGCGESSSPRRVYKWPRRIGFLKNIDSGTYFAAARCSICRGETSWPRRVLYMAAAKWVPKKTKYLELISPRPVGLLAAARYHHGRGVFYTWPQRVFIMAAAEY